MSFAFLALYTGDYLRDTRGLSPLAHGIYLLLLMFQWDTRGPLPKDEQDIAGIANCRSSDEIEALRRVLNRFFIRMDDGYYNPRMQREIERACALSLKRKYAGAKGYQAIAKHLHGKSPASAQQQPLPPPPPPPSPSPPQKPVAIRDVSDLSNSEVNKGADQKIAVEKIARQTSTNTGQQWGNRVWVTATAARFQVDLRQGEDFDGFRDRVYAAVQQRMAGEP